MSEYKATVRWTRRPDETYVDNQYSRGHEWTFDGGLTIPASSSPQVVPLPCSVETSVDPEEAYVASLSSCHMLFFLAIAARRKYVVDSYSDDAVGIMEQNESGKLAMTRVTLRPRVLFSGARKPTPEELRELHEQAHESCFIANSVKTQVTTDVTA